MFLLLLACRAPTSAADSRNSIADPRGAFFDLDTWIDSERAAVGIPGLAVAVVHGGAVVHTAGFGLADIDLSEPVTTDTPFMLASVSKTVIGVSVAEAADAGTLDLDADINTFLPFAIDNPLVDETAITTRQLATHTGSIRDNSMVENSNYSDGDSPIAMEDYVEGYLVPGGQWYNALGNFDKWLPGTTYEYSNMGATLLARSVEAVDGRDFADVCETDIFAPIGMTNTHWHLSQFLDPTLVAMPYDTSTGTPVADGRYGYPDYPDGGLRASAADMGRYLAAVSTGGMLDGVQVIPAAAVSTMLTQQISPDVAAGQGLIWYSYDVGGRTVWGHNGSDYGVATEIGFDPTTGDGFIVLLNTDWSSAVNPTVATIEERLMEEVAG